jgi:hypothetical protein
MTIHVQDVPAPAKANARSLKATYDRIGGANERERVAKFEALLESNVRDRTVDMGGVVLEEAAELSLGPKWRQRLIDGRGKQVALLEADAPGGQAVSSDFFNAVTGQRVFSEIRQASELPQFYLTQRIPITKSDHLGPEIVPEIEGMGDVSEELLEAQGVPFVGLGPHTTQMPDSKKRALGIQLTEEVLKVTSPVGLTASLVGQANRVGLFLAYKGEVERADVVIGYVNPYVRDGVATDTYLAAGAYVNKQTGVALVDYTDIDAAEQLLSEILDPDTGLPTPDLMGTRDLIVSPANVMNALAIVGATEIRRGDITTGTGLQTISGNPLNRVQVNVISSKIIYQRILATLESEVAKAKAGWIYGSLDAFGWKEFMPLQVFQQGPGHLVHACTKWQA